MKPTVAFRGGGGGGRSEIGNIVQNLNRNCVYFHHACQKVAVGKHGLQDRLQAKRKLRKMHWPLDRAAPTTFLRLHASVPPAHSPMRNIVRGVVLAKTSVWALFFLRDCWVYKCLVVRSTEHCFCFGMLDCVVNTPYSSGLTTGCMMKTHKYVRLFCCFGTKGRAVLEDGLHAATSQNKVSLMRQISAESGHVFHCYGGRSTLIWCRSFLLVPGTLCRA